MILSTIIDMITKISLQNKKSPWVSMRYEDWPARTFLIKNPCVYREHNSYPEEENPLIGLSLCIQGTPSCAHSRTSCNRFIPVHTGNTVLVSSRATRPAVYPCAYREHAIRFWILANSAGLSLCIQGTYDQTNTKLYEDRFIPVHTGNIFIDIVKS